MHVSDVVINKSPSFQQFASFFQEKFGGYIEIPLFSGKYLMFNLKTLTNNEQSTIS